MEKSLKNAFDFASSIEKISECVTWSASGGRSLASPLTHTTIAYQKADRYRWHLIMRRHSFQPLKASERYEVLFQPGNIADLPLLSSDKVICIYLRMA